MSLLLDALKKAALDKKNRDQQLLKTGDSQLQAGVENSDSGRQVNVLVSRDSIATEGKTFDEGERPDSEEHLTLHSQQTDNQNESVLNDGKLNTSENDKNALDPQVNDDELEFDANEFEELSEENSETESLTLEQVSDEIDSVARLSGMGSEVENETNRELNNPIDKNLQTASNLESKGGLNLEEEHDFASRVLQNSEALPSTAEADKTTSEDTIVLDLELEEEKVARQKEEKKKLRLAAMGELIQRKRKAERANQGKRMVLLAVLIVVALLFVGFYYYFLGQSTDAHSLYVPPSASQSVPAGIGTVVEENDVASEENPQVAHVEPASTAEKTPSLTSTATESKTDKTGNETKNAGEGVAKIKFEEKTSDVKLKEASDNLLDDSKVGSKVEDSKVANTVKQKPVQGVIARSEQKSPLGYAIDEGYRAWQKGDWLRAEQYYQQALNIDAMHRDALLGAAAVALAQGKEGRALNLYQRRLAHAPRDDYALAGIMSLAALQGKQNEIKVELQNLLQTHPEAAHLYFLRASIFAKENNWMQAQKDFFEAWKRDGQQPDYVFNLAVSMDHLGSQKEALHFYQQAEQLAQQSAHNFDLAGLRARVSQLQSGGE